MTDEYINQKLSERGVAEYLQGAGREGLLRGWRTFVKEVEAGYRLGLDDYRNDLDRREILEFVGLGDDAEVQSLDARFRNQLQDTHRAIWRSDNPNAFWIWGYPQKISDEFREDLKRVSH